MEAEVPDQEFRRHQALGIRASDRLQQKVPEGDGEPVRFRERLRSIDPDALGIPGVDRLPQGGNDPLLAVAVVNLLVVELLDHRVPRLHVGAEVDLFGLRSARVMEDVGGPYAAESAANLVVERVRVVFAIEDDPHVDAVSPHRRKERRRELFLDDGGLHPSAFESSRNSVPGFVR